MYLSKELATKMATHFDRYVFQLSQEILKHFFELSFSNFYLSDNSNFFTINFDKIGTSI